MTPRMLMTVVALGISAVGAPQVASAQAQPDTAGLAQAVGALLVDSVLPYLGDRNDNFVMAPATAFDSAVAVILQADPRIRPAGSARPPSHEWIGTRGLTLRGDTGAVLVEVGTTSPAPGEFIDTYREVNRFLFVRDGRGWRFVRREFVSGSDSGPVRG